MVLRTKIIVLLMVMAPAVVRAEAPIGQVAFVKGAATIQHVSSSAAAAKFGADVFQMDTIETGDGEIKVLFVDKTLLTLGTNSKVLITEHVYNPKNGVRKSLFSVVKGTIRAIVDQTAKLKENDVRLQTATAVAGIRGTDAGVHAMPRAARFACFDGAFEAYAKSNPQGSVMVRSGEWTEIVGPTPTRPAAITPDVMRQFSDVLGSDSVKDILKQAGAETIAATPTSEAPAPPSSGSSPPPEAPEGTPQSPQQEQPPAQQYLPGGNTNTPSDAGGSSSVSVPLTFPSQ